MANKPTLKLPYFKIESFGAVDGPGIRLVIFSQGCYYRCLYCHNPESWNNKKSKQITVNEIINLYKKNISFYTNGGITISGGDPLIHIDFIIELAKKCKWNNISLALDTAGVNFCKKTLNKYKKICLYKPLWIVDCKHINKQKHKKLVGIGELREIKLIKFLDINNQEIWIRQVLIPNLTDKKNDLINLGKFMSKLKNLKKFELLPYHKLAINKYIKLKIKYPLLNIDEPNEKEINKSMTYIKYGLQKK